MPNRGEDRMGYGDVRVLDELHIVRGNDHAQIAKRLHLAPFESRETDGRGAGGMRYLESVQDVWGVAATADGERQVVFGHERSQLLGEDVFIPLIVGPRRHQGYVVGERQDAESAISVPDGALPQVARAMGGQSRAATIPKDEHGMFAAVGVAENIRDRIDDREGEPFEYGRELLKVNLRLDNIWSGSPVGGPLQTCT